MSGKRTKALAKKFYESDFEGPDHFTGGIDGLKRPWRAFKRQQRQTCRVSMRSVRSSVRRVVQVLRGGKFVYGPRRKAA